MLRGTIFIAIQLDCIEAMNVLSRSCLESGYLSHHGNLFSDSAMCCEVAFGLRTVSEAVD